jgi:hypothetical protein
MSTPLPVLFILVHLCSTRWQPRAFHFPTQAQLVTWSLKSHDPRFSSEATKHLATHAAGNISFRSMPHIICALLLPHNRSFALVPSSHHYRCCSGILLSQPCDIQSLPRRYSRRERKHLIAHLCSPQTSCAWLSVRYSHVDPLK